MLWDPLERFLWAVAIVLIFICAGLYFYRANQQEEPKSKLFIYGFGVFFFGWGLFTVFHFFGEFFIAGEYKNGVFVIKSYGSDPMFRLLFKLSRTSYAICLALTMYCFGRALNSKIQILTIINIVFVFLLICATSETLERVIWFMTYGFNITIILIFLVKFAKWSRYELKAVTFLKIIGLYFLTAGGSLAGPEAKQFNELPLIYPPIYSLIGVVIIIFLNLIDVTKHQNLNKYLIIIYPSVLSFYLFMIIYSIIFFEGSLYYNLFILILNSFNVLLSFWLLKDVKSDTSSISQEKLDILGVFTRPKKLTEEEVSVAKEKQICLVCKNKLSGHIFLCSNCGAFYCIKCSDTLSTLENACWVCETPFDESKPVKLPEKDNLVEEALIEDESVRKFKPN